MESRVVLAKAGISVKTVLVQLIIIRSFIMKHISVGDFQIGNDLPFALLAGPCALENRDHAFFMCERLKEITTKLDIPFIYKTS